MKGLTFEQFEGICFHTFGKIIIPLKGNRISLDKHEFFTKGKYDSSKLRSKLREIYEQNLNVLND